MARVGGCALGPRAGHDLSDGGAAARHECIVAAPRPATARPVVAAAHCSSELRRRRCAMAPIGPEAWSSGGSRSSLWACGCMRRNGCVHARAFGGRGSCTPGWPRAPEAPRPGLNTAVVAPSAPDRQQRRWPCPRRQAGGGDAHPTGHGGLMRKASDGGGTRTPSQWRCSRPKSKASSHPRLASGQRTRLAVVAARSTRGGVCSLGRRQQRSAEAERWFPEKPSVLCGCRKR